MYHQIHCSNSSPIPSELSVRFESDIPTALVVSQICICHENINKPLDGAYLADFGINIRVDAIDVCG